MNRRKTAKILSLIVSVVGLMVIAGWIFDIGILKSISPDWASMKFDTALAFVLSGIILYFIARAMEGEFDTAQVILSITALMLFLLMGTLFFSAVLGMYTGTETLFVSEAQGAVKTLAPGRPSILTIFNFFLMALTAVLTMLNLGRVRPKLRVIGFVIVLIGGLAIIGYIVSVPLLYYFVPNINTAMAFYTAVLFILLGIGLICL